METIVTIVEEDGKWHMTGTTYLAPGQPWPVDVMFDTEEQALEFASKHNYTVE